MHERILPVLAAVLLAAARPAGSHFKYKIGIAVRSYHQRHLSGSNWEEKAQFLGTYLATRYMSRNDVLPLGIHWINSSADVDPVAALTVEEFSFELSIGTLREEALCVYFSALPPTLVFGVCELRKNGVVALLVSNECAPTAVLARKARQARLPFLAVLNRGCSRQWVLREAYGNQTKAGDQRGTAPGEPEEPAGTLLVPYFEEFDVRVVLAKIAAMRVNRALVVYDDAFATYGMEIFKEQTEGLNLTMAFVPLEANRTNVNEAISQTLRRLARRNSFYTSFIMLVFANFTLAERLDAELITHVGINPNMRLLLFYNGWDKSLGRWYYQHEVRYPYEKLIYVITRAYIHEARNIMKTASASWGSHDHVFTLPDITTLVFIHYVIEYMSRSAHRLPESTACGTPMDDVLEHMQRNITAEVKRLAIHSSAARYRTYFLAPVTSKEYQLKLMENWSLNNATLERTLLLSEVDAYLRNRTLNFAVLELPPYSIYGKGPRGSIILSGTFLRFVDYMQEIYGFNVTYQLIENETSVGVKFGEDYSWSGSLGKLNTRETDLVAFMDITEERVHSFSMTDGIISHPMAMLVQTPKILSRKLLFVQPFTTQVWILVLVSIPVVSVALWLVYNWSPEEAHRRQKGRGLSQLHNCAWYTYGALLQQGAVHLPVGTSSRLVVGTWWIYVVIVMAYYSSNLIAFLTVPEPQWLVPSFREAVRREDIHIYIPHGTEYKVNPPARMTRSGYLRLQLV
ncbi:glutamate receptor ionotropic, delta-1-like [Dermacentor albipictus]|uniref:glutamate receptor ionotropic, delta-1-like n=1 Tax=Dermacentor albipictus TaxID=60249 RepID=UPI0038FD339D